jgi:hypothetical protein
MSFTVRAVTVGRLLEAPVTSFPEVIHGIEVMELEKPFDLELLPGTCQISQLLEHVLLKRLKL